MDRWMRHEAGHIVVGLHFGFRIEGVQVFEGKPLSLCDLDAAERTPAERYVFLAGGIAAEKSDLNSYDRSACGDDQAKITERGGESIETYLSDAAEIIKAHRNSFQELKKKIYLRMLEKNMEGIVFGRGNTFAILTGSEIAEVWAGFR